jgi:transcriptional regulator with XRE-family HTH domain
MESNESVQKAKTLSDVLAEMFADEKDGKAFSEAFLKSGFLSAAVRTLNNVRRQANLTQAQVADVLETKQAAIARLEADTAGSMSLHRYVDFALACGMAPLDIRLVPINSLREYVMENPEAPRTAELYDEWLKKKSEAHLSYLSELENGLRSE